MTNNIDQLQAVRQSIAEVQETQRNLAAKVAKIRAAGTSRSILDSWEDVKRAAAFLKVLVPGHTTPSLPLEVFEVVAIRPAFINAVNDAADAVQSFADDFGGGTELPLESAVVAVTTDQLRSAVAVIRGELYKAIHDYRPTDYADDAHDLAVAVAGFEEAYFRKRSLRGPGAEARRDLSMHFEDVAKKDRVAANRLRSAAITSLLILTTGPVWPALGVVVNAGSAAGVELAHLWLALPLAALAAYLAREANRHRTSQRQADELAVRLRTLDPYLVGLDAEDQRMCRQAMAKTLFSPVSPIDDANAVGLYDDFARLLDRTVDAAKAAREKLGGSAD